MDKELSHEEKCKLIEEMYEWLLRITIRIGLGFQDAQDVVQEACYRFLKYRGLRKAAWLTRTTINLAFEFLKRRKPYLPLDVCVDIESKYLEPWEIIHKKNTLKIVHSTLMLMDEKYRAVLVLRYYEGLSVREISKRLRIPESTVISRLHRARRILINFLT